VASATTAAGATPLPHSSPFTAANGTALTAYTPATGSNGWAHELGTWQIQSNRAQPASFVGIESIACTDLGQQTATISVKATKTRNEGTDYAEVFFRFADVNNCMKIVNWLNNLVCYKVVAGVTTQVGATVTVAALNDTAEHTYQIVVGATTFDCSVDGVLQMNDYAIDAALTGNKAGIGSAITGTILNSAIVFDDFNATA
jgi:hypothetical protein